MRKLEESDLEKEYMGGRGVHQFAKCNFKMLELREICDNAISS